MSDTSTQEISILPENYYHPISSFTFDNNQCGAPCSISFTNTSEKAENYYWDFGDGANSDEVDPVHIYEKPGRFNVSLIASGNGHNDTSIQVITIGSITFFQPFLNELGPAIDLIQLDDGGYVLVGYSGFVAKVDKKGKIIWNGNYGSSDSRFIAILQDQLGDLVVLDNPSSTSFNYIPPALVKITTQGGGIYKKNLFPVTSTSTTSASDIALSSTGDYLIFREY